MQRLVLTSLLISTMIACFPVEGFAEPGYTAAEVQQLNHAAELAGQEQFAKAITVYETVFKTHPSDAKLKKNLATLYFNQGSILQQQKQYDAAMVHFQKTLKVMPSEPHAKQAIGSIYFSQAMDLRDAGSTDYAQMKTLLNKALTEDSTNAHFTKGLAAVYFDEALVFANQGNFEDAEPLLTQAYEQNSQNANIKSSLLNVRIALAQREIEPEKQQPWFDKALALDTTETTQQKIAQIKAHTEQLKQQANQPAQTTSSGGFEDNRRPMPKETSQLSVYEMVQRMETELGVTPEKALSLVMRLIELEKRIYGQQTLEEAQQPMAVRAKKAYAQVFGTQSADVAQDPTLVNKKGQAFLNFGSPIPTDDHYLADLMTITDGKIIRWAQFPIRVHIGKLKDMEEADAMDYEKTIGEEAYHKAVEDGVKQWETATNNFTRVIFIKNREAADVIIDPINEAYTDRFAFTPTTASNPHTEETSLNATDETDDTQIGAKQDKKQQNALTERYSTYKRPTINKPLANVIMLASMFAPGYFSLIPQAAMGAMQYNAFKKTSVLMEESRINVGLKTVINKPPAETLQQIQNMVAHEFAHVLGIKVNSTTMGDITHTQIPYQTTPVTISQRDLETLKLIYMRAPDIVLNVK